MNEGKEENGTVCPNINLIFGGNEEVALVMNIIVPQSYESISSIQHVVKIFSTEVNMLAERVNSYIQSEAKYRIKTECEDSAFIQEDFQTSDESDGEQSSDTD